MAWNSIIKKNIPENWTVNNLYSIANFINGLACQKFRPSTTEDALPVIKIREMHGGISSDTERVSSNIPDKYKIKSGDILFSWSATLEVMYWFGCDAGLNQHIFKVVPKPGFSSEFVFQQLSEYVIHFTKIAESRKTTMGHITSDHLSDSWIVIPPEKVICEYTEKVKPLVELQKNNAMEIDNLIAIRNWLLPMLMSGQATIAD